MSLNILSSKRPKFIILFFIIIILIIIYVIFQSFNNYFVNIKQSNKFLQREIRKLNSSSIQRAILIFYPSNQGSHYLSEVRWLYRSWIEMMKYESKTWRTDLIIYTGEYSSPFQDLSCIFNQIRINNTEQPRCRIFLYRRLSIRNINYVIKKQAILINENDKDLYQIDIERSKSLYNSIKTYEYIDSVNIISECYPTFEYYDFILKTDIDVFLTKQFAKYIPPTNMSLLVGRGGYSTEFNTRRLGRIAQDLKWEYKRMTNVGSTWYGPPHIAQRIANFTLEAILHLANHEFTPVERERKLGVLLWPDWHYGVLSMYGTHLAVNHLIISDKLDIIKADQLLDQFTTNTNQDDLEQNNRIHLHCWHTDQQFSKFQFKAGNYNQTNPQTLINDRSARAYAMRMALESQSMTLNDLGKMLHDIGNNKTK